LHLATLETVTIAWGLGGTAAIPKAVVGSTDNSPGLREFGRRPQLSPLKPLAGFVLSGATAAIAVHRG